MEVIARDVPGSIAYLAGQKRKDKVGVSLGILTYINAGAFDRTLEVFDGTAGLTPPKALSSSNEAQLASLLTNEGTLAGYPK